MKKLLFILMAFMFCLFGCEKQETNEFVNDEAGIIKTETASFTYNFTEGWADMSTFILPEDCSIENFFSPIAESFDVIKTTTASGSKVYWPPYANTIYDIDPADGYLIHITNDCNLTVSGEIVENIDQPLYENWQMCGVPYSEPQPVELIFPISAEPTNIVKSIVGDKVYWPAQNINTIYNLEPGRGYYIHISTSKDALLADLNKFRVSYHKMNGRECSKDEADIAITEKGIEYLK